MGMIPNGVLDFGRDDMRSRQFRLLHEWIKEYRKDLTGRNIDIGLIDHPFLEHRLSVGLRIDGSAFYEVEVPAPYLFLNAESKFTERVFDGLRYCAEVLCPSPPAGAFRKFPRPKRRR